MPPSTSTSGVPRVLLIFDGSTKQSEVDISSVPFPRRKGYAHSFGYGETRQSHLLNVGKIIVNSGVISGINGYHTADLSGSLMVAPPRCSRPSMGAPPEPGSTRQSFPQPVDRISFDALLPGASIQTGGDLNTLDVLNGVKLNSGPGIVIGRDLNLFNAGQDVDLSNGNSISVGRFLGSTPQPPKGTATGANFLAVNQALIGTGTSTIVSSLSGYLQGDLNIGPGSVFRVVSGIVNSIALVSGTTATPSVFLVNSCCEIVGAPTLVQQIQIGGARPHPFHDVHGSLSNSQSHSAPATIIDSEPANFVARNGFNRPLPPPFVIV